MNGRALSSVCALLITLAGFARADASDEFSGVGLHVVNGKAMLTDVTRPLGRDLSALTGAASIDTARILSRRENHGALFLVVHLEGPSRRNGGAGMCGAGTEGSIAWLKMFPGLLVTDERAILVDSCFLTFESSIESSHGKIRATVNAGSAGRGYTVRYDDSAADRGFSITPIP